MLNDTAMQIVANKVRKLVALNVKEIFKMDLLAFGGACMHFAYHGAQALQEQLPGEPISLQAGSVRWRIANEDQNVENKWWGYEWNMQHGEPLEYHCWIALTNRNMIVDFSTFMIKELMRNQGVTWYLPSQPPPFIVTTENNDMHEYIAVPAACLELRRRATEYGHIVLVDANDMN